MHVPKEELGNAPFQQAPGRNRDRGDAGRADRRPGLPRTTDAAGVGSNTTQYLLDQLSPDFNAAHGGATTKLYSWDAVNPYTLAIGDNITTKANCATIARANGSPAGITALDNNARPPGAIGLRPIRTRFPSTDENPFP